MAETCVVCSKALKEKYRLRDYFGKATQLGRVVEDLLDEDLRENTANSVCSKCRYALLHLEKLKRECDALKGNLKTQLRRHRASQQLRPQGQHGPVVRLRSPSAQSTGISPAAKRPAIHRPVSTTARKELFPLSTGQRLVETTASVASIVCGQSGNAQFSLLPTPLPPNRSPIRLSNATAHPIVATPPRLLTGSPVSRIPVANALPDGDVLAPVKVCVCVCVCMCMHLCVDMCIYGHVCKGVCVLSFAGTYPYPYIHACTFVFVHAKLCVCTYVCVLVHIHLHRQYSLYS